MTMRERALSLLAATAVTVLVAWPAFTRVPHAFGDSGEYLVMTEALFRHGRTDLRPEDAAAVDEAWRRGEIAGTFEPARESYVADRQGRARSLHFWAYPLACLPAKTLLHFLGGNEEKALPITNALLLLLAVLRGGIFSALPAGRRFLFAALLLVSPATWFVPWPHPEVFLCALVALGLVAQREGRSAAAVLLVSLASLQSPPLLLLALVLLAHALRDPRRRLAASLALLPAFVPFAFSLWSFGRLSPLSAASAGPQYLSARKALELFFDLDLGLLPYIPLALVGAIAAPLLAWRSRPTARLAFESWGVLLAMAFACTATVNWNHGTAGPSRYGIWMLPLVFDLLLLPLAAADLSTGVRKAVVVVGVLAVAAQGAVVVARGGFDPRPDYLEHSYAARFVFRHAPSLYNPSPEIFVERTLGEERPAEEPVVYRIDGRCRKMLVQKRYWTEGMALCGKPARLPNFKDLAPEDRRREWVYVEY
jgi:hypothetical protein